MQHSSYPFFIIYFGVLSTMHLNLDHHLPCKGENVLMYSVDTISFTLEIKCIVAKLNGNNLWSSKLVGYLWDNTRTLSCFLILFTFLKKNLNIFYENDK